VVTYLHAPDDDHHDPGRVERALLLSPYACEVCRARLPWHGGCLRCHGSATPTDRTTRRYTGDRYERDGTGHLRWGEGPAPCATVEAAAESVAQVRRLLDRSGVAISTEVRA
jgi:hypothetical protein